VGGSNSPSFRQLKFNYSEDKNNVYHRGNKIPQASPATFVILGDRYAKDENHVYYEDKILESADAKSFELVTQDGKRFYAKDKYKKFWYDKEIDEFPTTING